MSRPAAASLAGPRASRPHMPGLAQRGPRHERWRVPGGGSLLLPLRAGDRITVIDPEGRQPCELVAFDAAGHPATAALGRPPDGPPEGFLALLQRGGAEVERLQAALRRRGAEPAAAEAVLLFSPDGPAGQSETLTCERDLLLLAAAPGDPMPPDAQTPPTDLLLAVTRATLLRPEEMPLPEPLAEPRLELRVPRASALAYEVRAGEYVQVIDVAGRQCSDFLAFERRDLDRGLERGLDVTTTRTLMGAAYPQPGLLSRFYDQDMRALVEVVQDTVGRHDTFALACTARYYEDMGYPGHVNCTDNFNDRLAPWGIARRAGWPAVNFFYNTAFDEQHRLFLDEPWSRPGDYVLLRAGADLVCASSACPDDIDAANAWDPTDIHVRIYPAERRFSRAVAYRMTADADPRPTRETGFHSRTAALTRDFAEYRGFWLPNAFRDHGPQAEYWACRERAAAQDLSALRKFEVLGPDAEALLDHALTRDVRRLAPGQVVYSALCHPHGGMLDDGTLFRLGEDNFRWIGGDDYGGLWLRELAEKQGLKAWVRASTDQLHNLAVQGPRSREILKQVVWTPPARPSLEELGWFRFTVGRLGHAHGRPLVVSRTGYTGELGYELWCHPNDAPEVWDAVFEAGAPHDLAPLGLAALDLLRIEAGLAFAGHEFDDETDPFEAGIGFTVPLKSKQSDFIGREALQRRRDNPQRRLVGLELDGNEIAGHGDGLYHGRARIGVITSGCRSPVLGKTIALARVDVVHAEPGSELEVGKLDGRQKRLAARVVRFPFYDPEKARVRA